MELIIYLKTAGKQKNTSVNFRIEKARHFLWKQGSGEKKKTSWFANLRLHLLKTWRETGRCTYPIKEGKYYHILIGTIINDHVLNLEVITEMKGGWQKSRPMQRLILVCGCLPARRGSPWLKDESGAVLSGCLGKCMELWHKTQKIL